MSQPFIAEHTDIRSKFLSGLNAMLPWLAVAIAFFAVAHTAHIQRLATAAASGDPEAFATAKFLWLTLPAACCAGLLTAYFSKIEQRAIAGTAAIAVVALAALPGPAFLLPLLAIPAACIVAHSYFSIKDHKSWHSDIFAGALLTLILAFAASERQGMFFRVVNTKPDPDFFSYMDFAKTATGWSTKYREPFYIWILQLVDVLGGELNPIMVRLTSIGTAMAAIAAVFQLCRRHLNLSVAVIAALFYAGERFMVFTSARGLREDTIICTTILFVSVAWNLLRDPITWKSLTLLGLLGAACCLVRISGLSFVIAIICGLALYRSIRDTKPWKTRLRWLLPVGITFVLLLPYLLHCKREYNDMFFVVNYNTRFYANTEFGGKRPDFPTTQELAVDAYAGSPITPGQYIFKYHTINEIVSRSWGGFTDTFFSKTFKFAFNLINGAKFSGILYILYFAGICLLLFPSRLFLIIIMLLFHAPTFFLASFSYFDPRLLTVAMVFEYIAVASAIGLGLEYGMKFVTETNSDEPTYGSRKKPSEKKNLKRRSGKH